MAYFNRSEFISKMKNPKVGQLTKIIPDTVKTIEDLLLFLIAETFYSRFNRLINDSQKN